MSTLADDLIEGAGAAALFMFGDSRKRRVIYRMSEAGELPVIKKGKRLFYRKSDLERAFQVAEDEAVRDDWQHQAERRASDRLAEMIAPAITPFVLSLNKNADASVAEVMEQAVNWAYAWAEAMQSYRAERDHDATESIAA